MVPTDDAMITRQMLYSGTLLPGIATAELAMTCLRLCAVIFLRFPLDP
jgi:hypothetical protein